MPTTVSSHLSELDSLLAELNSVRYSQEQVMQENMVVTTSSFHRREIPVSQPQQFQDTLREQTKGNDIHKTTNPHDFTQVNTKESGGFAKAISNSPHLFYQCLPNSTNPISEPSLELKHPVTQSDTLTLKTKKHTRLKEFHTPKTDQTRKEKDDYTDYDYSSKWDYLGKGIWENQAMATLA